RITIELLAIREGELRRLGDDVNVVRRVVAERPQVEARDELELLQEYRALAPRPALVDRVAAIVGRHGRLDRAPVVAQILMREEPAVRGGVRDDSVGDLAPIERVDRCRDAIDPGASPAVLLGGDELPE